MKPSCCPLLFLLLARLAAPAADALPAPAPGGLRPWDDYRTILWLDDSVYARPERIPAVFARLRELGINTAMVYGDTDPRRVLTNGFPYYVENLVNRGLCLKFSSNVRDWDRFVTDWVRQGRPETAFVRDYCLEDPEWRGWARREVQSIARRNAPHRPLAYDLRDELSVTISANPFDYDFSPRSLAGFRAWLRAQDPDLVALNRRWNTAFASWDDVRPFSTDRIKHRMVTGASQPAGRIDWGEVQRVKFDPARAARQPERWNFSPWCDFRTYMDQSLAGALGDLRAAIHEVDPATPVGIEGTQMASAFGGYDLWRLSRVLDWVEPYDIGNAREIFGSFMPGSPILATIFEKDTRPAQRRLWHLLLEGDRGCIVWWSKDCLDVSRADVPLTAKGRALAPVLRDMTGPLARLFLRAERERDPVYLLYSQASIQVDWLLESTVDGSTWHRRFSSHESAHNRHLRVRNGWLKLFQDCGWSPQFVAAESLAAGRLAGASNAVLVLPETLALADREAAAIRGFLGSGGVSRGNLVFADAGPGLFDEHGRLRAAPALSPEFAPTVSAERLQVAGDRRALPGNLPADIAKYPQLRQSGDSLRGWTRWVTSHVTGVPRPVVVDADARVRVHRFRAGAARLVALERNIDYHMSEDLKQAGGNERLEQPVEVVMRLAAPAHVYDLRTGASLGRTAEVRLTVDPWQPTLLALTDTALPAGDVLGHLSAGGAP